MTRYSLKNKIELHLLQATEVGEHEADPDTVGDLLSLITEADNSEIYRIEANLFTRNYMLVSLSAIMDQKQEREKLEQALAQVQKTKAALTTQLKALDLQEEQLKEQLETLKEIELAGMDAK